MIEVHLKVFVTSKVINWFFSLHSGRMNLLPCHKTLSKAVILGSIGFWKVPWTSNIQKSFMKPYVGYIEDMELGCWVLYYQNGPVFVLSENKNASSKAKISCRKLLRQLSSCLFAGSKTTGNFYYLETVQAGPSLSYFHAFWFGFNNHKIWFGFIKKDQIRKHA